MTFSKSYLVNVLNRTSATKHCRNKPSEGKAEDSEMVD
ncbi:hypothetical protein VPHD260_0081 [Vibrio phage D260]